MDREESVLSNACPGIATKFYHAARSSEWRRPEGAFFLHDNTERFMIGLSD